MRRHQLRQRPLRGGRIPISGAFDTRIETMIMADVAQYGVSRQMVLTEIVAAYYRLDLDAADRMDVAREARKTAPHMIDPEASKLYRAFWEKTHQPVTGRQSIGATKRAKGGR